MGQTISSPSSHSTIASRRSLAALINDRNICLTSPVVPQSSKSAAAPMAKDFPQGPSRRDINKALRFTSELMCAAAVTTATVSVTSSPQMAVNVAGVLTLTPTKNTTIERGIIRAIEYGQKSSPVAERMFREQPKNLYRRFSFSEKNEPPRRPEMIFKLESSVRELSTSTPDLSKQYIEPSPRPEEPPKFGSQRIQIDKGVLAQGSPAPKSDSTFTLGGHEFNALQTRQDESPLKDTSGHIKVIEIAEVDPGSQKSMSFQAESKESSRKYPRELDQNRPVLQKVSDANMRRQLTEFLSGSQSAKNLNVMQMPKTEDYYNQQNMPQYMSQQNKWGQNLPPISQSNQSTSVTSSQRTDAFAEDRKPLQKATLKFKGPPPLTYHDNFGIGTSYATSQTAKAWPQQDLSLKSKWNEMPARQNSRNGTPKNGNTPLDSDRSDYSDNYTTHNNVLHKRQVLKPEAPVVKVNIFRDNAGYMDGQQNNAPVMSYSQIHQKNVTNKGHDKVEKPFSNSQSKFNKSDLASSQRQKNLKQHKQSFQNQGPAQNQSQYQSRNQNNYVQPQKQQPQRQNRQQKQQQPQPQPQAQPKYVNQQQNNQYYLPNPQYQSQQKTYNTPQSHQQSSHQSSQYPQSASVNRSGASDYMYNQPQNVMQSSNGYRGYAQNKSKKTNPQNYKDQNLEAEPYTVNVDLNLEELLEAAEVPYSHQQGQPNLRTYGDSVEGSYSHQQGQPNLRTYGDYGSVNSRQLGQKVYTPNPVPKQLDETAMNDDNSYINRSAYVSKFDISEDDIREFSVDYNLGKMDTSYMRKTDKLAPVQRQINRHNITPRKQYTAY